MEHLVCINEDCENYNPNCRLFCSRSFSEKDFSKCKKFQPGKRVYSKLPKEDKITKMRNMDDIEAGLLYISDLLSLRFENKPFVILLTGFRAKGLGQIARVSNMTDEGTLEILSEAKSSAEKELKKSKSN
jgi:hypothetical protein